jgi:hypothetical protein
MEGDRLEIHSPRDTLETQSKQGGMLGIISARRRTRSQTPLLRRPHHR